MKLKGVGCHVLRSDNASMECLKERLWNWEERHKLAAHTGRSSISGLAPWHLFLHITGSSRIAFDTSPHFRHFIDRSCSSRCDLLPLRVQYKANLAASPTDHTLCARTAPNPWFSLKPSWLRSEPHSAPLRVRICGLRSRSSALRW